MADDYRHVFGVVDGNGQAITRVGFSVSKVSGTSGLYDITFDQPFSDTPAVTATQVYPDQTDSNGGSTKDNAVLVYTRSTGCRIKTGDGNGDASNRTFCFTAIGT